MWAALILTVSLQACDWIEWTGMRCGGPAMSGFRNMLCFQKKTLSSGLVKWVSIHLKNVNKTYKGSQGDVLTSDACLNHWTSSKNSNSVAPACLWLIILKTCLTYCMPARFICT